MGGGGSGDGTADGLVAASSHVHSTLGRELNALNRDARQARSDMIRLLDHFGLARATEAEIDTEIAAEDAQMINNPARRASFERWKARNLPGGRTSN